MKRNQLLFAGLCAAGLLSGYVAKRLGGDPMTAGVGPASSAESDARAARDTKGDDAPAGPAKPVKPALSTLRSTETLESLKAADPADLYGRLALWMVDASEEDIAAYWQHYRQQENRANPINDLIFINWTRLNPRGATAAAAGTPDEHYAWWAWASHDPKQALAVAMAENPDRVNNVTWGIGEFHPNWLREHFEEIPEAGRDNALSGMAKWDDGEEPLETLKFLKEHGRGFDTRIFKVLIRKDPWAAYDWIQENGNSQAGPYGGTYDALGTFVETIGEQHPDVLERIAELAPSGELKRKMEAALFASLLKTDPEAAIEQAKNTKAPVIAAERLAAAGMSFVRDDPDKAFEMAESLLAAYPGALTVRTTVEFPNGSTSSGAYSGQVTELMDALMIKDPARVMGINMPAEGDSVHGGSAFSQLAGKWAERDLASYAKWVDGQSDPAVREPAAVVVIDRLQSDDQYADAIGWAMSLDKSRGTYLRSLFSQWRNTDSDGALEWLNSADLPEEEFNQLKAQIPDHP